MPLLRKRGKEYTRLWDGPPIYGHIIREIKASFAEAEVIHESRKSNGEAHSLAKSLIYNSVVMFGCYFLLMEFVLVNLIYE